MTGGPKQILFQESLSADNKAIFRSQIDLAEQIRQTPETGFEDKTVESIRVFLNQVLLPASAPRSRPLSPNLKNALHRAIEKRLGVSQRTDDIIRRLYEAFVALKDPALGSHPVDDIIEWPALFQRVENAKTHVIFTPSPAESRAGQSHAEELTQALIQRALATSTLEEDIQYRFYVFDFAEAVRMREILIFKISQTVGRDKKKAELLIEDAEKKGRLAINSISMKLWHPQLVVFDPETPNISGFGLSYHPENAVSVNRLSSEELKVWYKKTYLPLKSGDFDKRIQRVSIE